MKPTAFGIIAAMMILILFIGGFRYADKPKMEVCTYIVREDDTLWNLSKKYCPNEWDLRKWQWEVQKLNDLCDNEFLIIGRRIKILKEVK